MVKKIRCPNFERFTHFEPPEYEEVVFVILCVCVHARTRVSCMHTTLVTKQVDFIHRNHPPN